MKPVIAKTAALKLLPAIRMIERGQYPEAHAELCRLTGYQGRMPAPLVPAVVPELGHGVIVPGPQPKPEGRIVDEGLLRRFRERHPVCWVVGCGRPSGPAHHLRKRSDHGGDVEENLFALCLAHHTLSGLSFHEIRPYGAGFYLVYAHRLALEHKARIVAALPEIEVQIAAVLRGELTVYPAEARALIAA